jgi:hypothetical protein
MYGKWEQNRIRRRIYQCTHTTELEISIKKKFIDIGECNFINSIHVDDEVTQYAGDIFNIMAVFVCFSSSVARCRSLLFTDPPI